MNLVERSLDNRDLTSFLELRFDAAMLKRLWRRIVERRRRNIAELEQIEIYRLFEGWEASKANCINRVYGAGDGNRTHVRSLGGLRLNQGLRIPLSFSSLVAHDGRRLASSPVRCPLNLA